jgi:putative oxygen-independent coproporphyrinogen III oxidase
MNEGGVSVFMTRTGRPVDAGLRPATAHPGLYVHVPFCRSKCPYCDFFSVPSLEWAPQWLQGIQQEASHYRELFAPFDTLYLGGGTPSLLTDSQLAALLKCLRSSFDFTAAPEVTLEVNPDDLTRERLKCFRDSGVNRISIGVQSFQDEELRILRRRHSAGQTKRVLEWVRAAGFANVGVDLMYGLPGQTLGGWLNNLEHALELRPEHLSCYQLTIADSTPFGKMLAEGRITALSEEHARAFFLLTSELLEERGYIHYEVSNFALGEPYLARHNSKYWKHVPYLGLGPAAHSFHGNRRWWNVDALAPYCQQLAAGVPPVAECESLTASQVWLETLCLGFRTRSGIELASFQDVPGAAGVLHELELAGLLQVQNTRVVPTRTGLLVADSLPLLFSDPGGAS